MGASKRAVGTGEDRTFMPTLCLVGKHRWDGCKCLECGKTRYATEESHDWSKNCEEYDDSIRRNTSALGGAQGKY